MHAAVFLPISLLPMCLVALPENLVIFLVDRLFSSAFPQESRRKVQVERAQEPSTPHPSIPRFPSPREKPESQSKSQGRGSVYVISFCRPRLVPNLSLGHTDPIHSIQLGRWWDGGTVDEWMWGCDSGLVHGKLQ